MITSLSRDFRNVRISANTRLTCRFHIHRSHTGRAQTIHQHNSRSPNTVQNVPLYTLHEQGILRLLRVIERDMLDAWDRGCWRYIVAEK